MVELLTRNGHDHLRRVCKGLKMWGHGERFMGKVRKELERVAFGRKLPVSETVSSLSGLIGVRLSTYFI